MHLKIIRLTELSTPQLGVLLVDGVPKFVTLELPDKKNERQISCIPEGIYVISRRAASMNITANFGQTFEVTKVPHRSDILIHVGNVPGDLKGCIAIGTQYGDISGSPAILNSKVAFIRFMEILDHVEETSLSITHC